MSENWKSHKIGNVNKKQYFIVLLTMKNMYLCCFHTTLHKYIMSISEIPAKCENMVFQPGFPENIDFIFIGSQLMQMGTQFPDFFIDPIGTSIRKFYNYIVPQNLKSLAKKILRNRAILGNRTMKFSIPGTPKIPGNSRFTGKSSFTDSPVSFLRHP